MGNTRNYYTELQAYRINYITDRKVRILNRLKEIREEITTPDIMYEQHKKLEDEKKDLCAEFDSLAMEYKEIVGAREKYELCCKMVSYLQKKWGFPAWKDEIM